MERDAHAAIERTEIDLDVRCAACGYNLRSRDVSGRCPECGTLAGVTLLDRVRHSDVTFGSSRPDPHVLRQAIEGIHVLAVAFALMIAIAAAPESWLSIRSWKLLFLYWVQCACWVLACWGFWKLGAAPQARLESFRTERALRAVLPISTLMLVSWPVQSVLVREVSTLRRSSWAEFLLYNGLIVVLLTIGPAFMFRLRQLASGLGARGVAACASVLACACATSVFWRPFGDYARDAYIFRVPIPLLGSFQLWRRAIDVIREWSWVPSQTRTDSWVPLCVWLCGALTLGMFWRRARRALREANTPRRSAPPR